MKVEKIIPWGNPDIQKYLYCPKDGAHYVILNDGSWQFVDMNMVKMCGPDYKIQDTTIFFNYTQIVPNPLKNNKLKEETGFYELYTTENLFGWNEKNVHYYDYDVVPWDCDDRIYVELIDAKLDPETCTQKYKEMIHENLSKPFSYKSKLVARYFTNLRTGEAYIFLAGGAWQFYERNDETGVHFISEYGIDYTYDENDRAMDFYIFCFRDNEFDEWTFTDPEEDADFSLYEFENFFGKNELYISYKSKKTANNLDTMFFDITEFKISPEQAKAFFNYDLYNKGEFAIAKNNLTDGDVYKNKFGIVQSSILFSFVLLLAAGFYYLVLKVIPSEFDHDQLFFFSSIWAVILLCFIFPFLAAKNQRIEISKEKIYYTNMFGKKTEYTFKEIFGIKHISASGKTGNSILIFPKDSSNKIITLHERQYRKFFQIDEILTNNLNEVTLEEYLDFCSQYD